MPLPPDVSERDFASAIDAFTAAVGSEWVFTADQDVALYRDAYSPFRDEEEERLVSAAVAPSTLNEVREVMRIANRFRIPLYPISTGRNLAYGGSAPVLSGSVVLDLKRMNRILEVSEENAYALVEPGVSYFDLYRHIQERSLALMIDVPTPGWGSVLGNALEHGVGLTPLRDHFAAQCGMEVVLADGTVLRTGMGAMPKARTWQQFKYGIGPYIDGLFSQSNFGVVTKMGIWLLPEPEMVRGLRVRAKRHDHVMPMVNIMAELSNSGVIDSQFSLRSPVLHGPRDQELEALARSEGDGPPRRWDRYAASRNLPFWEAIFSFYGPAPLVNARWSYTVDRFSVLPDVEFADAPSYSFPMTAAARSQTPDKAVLGIPSLSDFIQRGPAWPGAGDGHVDLSIVIPMTGRAVLEALKVMGREFADSGVEVGMGAITSFHPRSFTFISSFPTYREDREANRRSRNAYRRAIELAAEHGWGLYRAHSAFMDLAMSTYSYNDHALARFHESLKDAVDPNGILAAGRYGIWPAGQRQRG